MVATGVESSKDVLDRLSRSDKSRHPIVLGLVAPIGAGVDATLEAFESCLKSFHYSVKTIKLAELLDQVKGAPFDQLPQRGGHRR